MIATMMMLQWNLVWKGWALLFVVLQCSRQPDPLLRYPSLAVCKPDPLLRYPSLAVFKPDPLLRYPSLAVCEPHPLPRYPSLAASLPFMD